MKIGILGGTFDPPHEGHISLAENVLRELELDRLFFVPLNIPPHKDELTPAVHRLAMARAAFGNMQKTEVWDGEIKRGGVSYTIDTLSAFRAAYPGAELYLTVGADSFFQLEKWHRASELIPSAIIVTASREEGEEERLLSHARRLRELYGADVRVLSASPFPVSSTELREGKRPGLIPLKVRDHIADNGLYHIPTEALESAARERESPKRFSHSMSAAGLCLELARAHGIDGERLFRAAVLHDVTKDLSLDEQLKILVKYDKIPNYDPREYPSPVHSFTGALVARYEFFMPPDVTDMISCHTLGKTDMSLEEKILFVADKTEPTRPYPDAAPIRELAFGDIDLAVYKCLERTAMDIERKGERAHPDIYKIMDTLRPPKEESK